MKRIILLSSLLLCFATLFSVSPANRYGHREKAPLNKITEVPEGYFIMSLYPEDFGGKYEDVADCAMTRAAKRTWNAKKVYSAHDIHIWEEKIMKIGRYDFVSSYMVRKDVKNPINYSEFQECKERRDEYDPITPIWQIVVQK